MSVARWSDRTRRFGAVVAAAALAAGVAACGSSNSNQSSTVSGGAASGSASAATSSQSGGSSSQSGGSSSSIVSFAQSQVAKFAHPPTTIGITQPLAVKPTGKIVDYVSCDAPLCVSVGNNLAAAAAILGMKVNVVQGGTTPQATTAAFDKVVQDHPNGLIDMNYPPQQFEPQLAALCKTGTSVFLNNVNPPTKNPCITGYVFNQNDSTLTAQQAAYKMIADSGGQGHVVYLSAPDIGPGNAFALKQFLNTMAKCSGCKTNVLSVSVTDVGTSLPGKLVSFLQAHPDVKYVRAYYGDQFQGVPAAISAAGIQGVKLYDGGGSKVNWAYIKAGQETADWALYLNAYGYQLADLLARAMTKQKFVIPLLPYMWVTKDNVNFNWAAGEPPFGIDYVAAFKKLWSQAK